MSAVSLLRAQTLLAESRAAGEALSQQLQQTQAALSETKASLEAELAALTARAAQNKSRMEQALSEAADTVADCRNRIATVSSCSCLLGLKRAGWRLTIMLLSQLEGERDVLEAAKKELLQVRDELLAKGAALAQHW
jgi:chromosome segregation ATPase